MKLLLTAGPTREPIDAVRYLGNRSSGQMGSALAHAALARGHQVTVVLGPVIVPFPEAVVRVKVETTEEMRQAVLRLWPDHDVLVMAAAVADFRLRTPHPGKLDRRTGKLVLELEPTPVIVAEASRLRRAGQRVVGFALEPGENANRARDKLAEKGLDLLVVNPLSTMNASDIEATLMWPDGRSRTLGKMDKQRFADELMREVENLFDQ